MIQRLVAVAIAVPAILALLIFCAFARLPYGYYAAGDTLDVLGQDSDAAEIIQVDGHPAYYDDGGELRMTWVSVSPPQEPSERGQNVWTVLDRWFDSDDAVYPYEAIHPPEETKESNEAEGAAQMAGSQESAIEVAMTEAGITVPQVIGVAQLTEGLPAEKVLKVGDRIISVDGTRITDMDTIFDLIGSAKAGQKLTVVVQRDGERLTLTVPTVDVDGATKMGFTPAVEEYRFPFDVRIRIDPAIGGPSAGLIFSLAVYDTLTPGSLTGGKPVAGTGELFPDGTVGPIGGVEQKIAAAREDGAELFLVPADNCHDALKANNGDMRLMKATSMHDVRVALDRFAQDSNADLPSCEDG